MVVLVEPNRQSHRGQSANRGGLEFVLPTPKCVLRRRKPIRQRQPRHSRADRRRRHALLRRGPVRVLLRLGRQRQQVKDLRGSQLGVRQEHLSNQRRRWIPLRSGAVVIRQEYRTRCWIEQTDRRGALAKQSPRCEQRTIVFFQQFRNQRLRFGSKNRSRRDRSRGRACAADAGRQFDAGRRRVPLDADGHDVRHRKWTLMHRASHAERIP